MYRVVIINEEIFCKNKLIAPSLKIIKGCVQGKLIFLDIIVGNIIKEPEQSNVNILYT